ncbi:class I SAM-dependent methyltransferase [Saccharothrix deserti]|uniref:class I SAM-dependent methyltransferase n=1 Tax=Saccharothrix deserti TaxID=2593674 RepID=UPI00131D1667|nr:class I SAM-dependent methyltransferase [Saccharothrix deserti]
MSTDSWGFAASTGLDFTEDTIVDAHFRACRDAYRRLLLRVGIEPGRHVLDAGCGGGSFLPWLAELVGPEGRITGVDLAPENVELAADRARSFGATVEIRLGDLRELPVETASVDVVWCANAVQYLDDDDLLAALREAHRVLRPGGTVAVKDLDAGLVSVRPGDPFLFADFFRRAAESPGYARRLLRTRDLYRWLTVAGFTAVRQETVLIEHFSPFSPAVRDFYDASCAQIAVQAGKLGLPGAWEKFLNPSDPDNPLNDPLAYISEGNVLAMGTKRDT